MKQKFRKLGGLILSMMLVFGIVSPVFAEDDKTGSITIHKYEVIDDSAVNFDENVSGAEQTVADAEPLAGVVFYIEKVKVTENMTESGADMAEVDDSWEPVELVTNSDGEIELTGLPLGVYRITEKPTDLISSSLESFLVTIPFVDPDDESSLLYHVHVYPKNTLYGQPEITDWLTGINELADTVGFTKDGMRKAHFIIDVDIPIDIASAGLASDQGNPYKFQIIDTIDSRLVPPTVDAITITGVKSTMALDENVQDNNALPAELYQVSVDGQTITITLNNGLSGWKTTDADGNETLLFDALRIEFECALSEEGLALSNAGQPISNKAALVYTNSLGRVVYTGYNDPTTDVDDATAKESQSVEVHTTAIRLRKVDGTNNELRLKGAVFGIYADKNCRDAIVDANGDPITGTSGDDGIITFQGLTYGETGDAYDQAETTYYVKELEAPSGYQVYSTVYEVVANASSAADGAIVEVVNYQSFTLPATGLTGTNMMILGLIAILAGIVGVTVIRKKRS